MVEVPAAAVTHVQVVDRPLGVLIKSPPGKTSVKLTPFNALFPAVVLAIAKINVLVPPTAMGSVPKDFEMVGGGGFGQPDMMTLSI